MVEIAKPTSVAATVDRAARAGRRQAVRIDMTISDDLENLSPNTASTTSSRATWRSQGSPATRCGSPVPAVSRSAGRWPKGTRSLTGGDGRL